MKKAELRRRNVDHLVRELTRDEARAAMTKALQVMEAYELPKPPEPMPCDHPHFNVDAHNLVSGIGWFVTALCGIFFLLSFFK